MCYTHANKHMLYSMLTYVYFCICVYWIKTPAKVILDLHMPLLKQVSSKSSAWHWIWLYLYKTPAKVIQARFHHRSNSPQQRSQHQSKFTQAQSQHQSNSPKQDPKTKAMLHNHTCNLPMHLWHNNCSIHTTADITCKCTTTSIAAALQDQTCKLQMYFQHTYKNPKCHDADILRKKCSQKNSSQRSRE